jgi:hypothetical protein
LHPRSVPRVRAGARRRRPCLHDPYARYNGPWVSDVFGIPLLFLLIVVMPVGVAVFFSLFAIKTTRPLVFLCRRCSGRFHRPPHRGFPPVCPHCHARDWNA